MKYAKIALLAFTSLAMAAPASEPEFELDKRQCSNSCHVLSDTSCPAYCSRCLALPRGYVRLPALLSKVFSKVATHFSR